MVKIEMVTAPVEGLSRVRFRRFSEKSSIDAGHSVLHSKSQKIVTAGS